MDKNQDRELYDLIRQLSKGLRKHGVKKVVRALKEINIVSENDIKFTIIDYIEKLVCDTLGVPLDELFSFDSRGEITIARKFCILLIRNHLDVEDISNDEIANHYNRTRQVVHTTINEYRSLMEGKKNPFHINFLAIYNDLAIETTNFVKPLKKKK